MSRPRPRIVWTPARGVGASALHTGEGGAAVFDAMVLDPILPLAPAEPTGVERAIAAVGVPTVDRAATPKDDVIGLLRLAAEVEHALMVQYLYTAASVDEDGGTQSRRARRAIVTVAVQEMGHLVAVQNLLLAIGGADAHHLGRDGNRAASERNPLPLVLERLGHAALAKYVTVESPETIEDAALRARVAELRREAEQAAQTTPHLVSALYAAIYWIFQPTDAPFGPLALPAERFRAGWHLDAQRDFKDRVEVDRYATTTTEWEGYPGLVVRPVHDAREACDLLFDVMEQGEGAPGGAEDSHFESFLRILDRFEAGQVKVRSICRTPRVENQPPPEDTRATTLTHPYAAAWGRLFNLRYTHLVLTIGHALALPVGDPDRAALVPLALKMMRPGLSGAITRMTELFADPAETMLAGPPFGLLEEDLPSSSEAFRARHRVLLADQDEAVAAVRARAEHASDVSGQLLLEDLERIDGGLRALLAAHPDLPLTSTGGQMRYAIYPPIGLARLGNSTTGYYVGPERAGSRGTEPQNDGTEPEVAAFKDATFRVKPQAARFHVFEVPDDGAPPRPARLPDGATVRWSVRLVNKKDAVVRPGGPPDEPTLPQADPARQDRVIDSGPVTIEGAGAGAGPLVGRYLGHEVRLGELRTDAAQRLLVLGGTGRSESPEQAPIGGSFYNNPGWFDDVGDGPVTAVVVGPDGTETPCTPAWIVVAPPDFAPPCQGVVTLYDVILQAAIDAARATLPDRPSFDSDIRPMLERARNLRHVDNGATWPLVSDDWPRLADPGDASRNLRVGNATLVRMTDQLLHEFALQDWQERYLDRWTAGDFDPGPAAHGSPAAALTRAVLDGGVGQGFFPGIEAGILVTDAALYAAPFEFRFDHGALSAGDVTALMALPWQADFLKCGSGWWPTQRPDVAPQPAGARPPWLRPPMDHARLARDVMKLGVVARHSDGAGGEVVAETGRDPGLG